MEKVQILVVGKDPVVIQKLLRFINENPNWEGTGTVDNQTALTLFEQTTFPLVVLVDYFSESELEMFSGVLTKLNPHVIFLRHFGDSTGLLASELYDLMEKYPVQLSKEEIS